MTSGLIGIENAATESGVTVRKDYSTATPDQATGYAATSILDEAPETSWRSTDTARDNTALLVRLPKTRNLRALSAVRHNLGRHATWRATADDEYATRPAWETDGVDDFGLTTETIPASADLTLLMRVWPRPLTVAGNSGSMQLLSLSNVAGTRLTLFFGTGWALFGRVDNWGVQTFTGSTGILPEGRPVDIAVRYTDATDLLELLLSGVVVASVTATTPWSDNGAEKLLIGASVPTAPAAYQDIRIVGRPLTDTEIGAYRAEVQTGTERNLLGSWHFAEGSGTTVADSTSTSPMSLTGGTWRQRVNPSPRYSTGLREAWDQWEHRQAIILKPGTYVTSPVLGAAERSITLACDVLVPADAALVDQGAIAWYGPTLADAEAVLETTSDGKLRARSHRGVGPHTVTSDAAVDDGLVRRARITLNGRNSTLNLYIGSGSSAETAQGTQATGLDAYGVLADCKVEVGDSTATTEATCRVSDVRLYSEIRLEADDDLTTDQGVTDPEMLAHLRLDGSLVDQVDQTRSYASAAVTYGEIEQAATRTLTAGHKRRTDATGDPYARYPHWLIAFTSAETEITEVYIEFWDPDNSDGYVSMAVLLVQDGIETPNGFNYTRTRTRDRRLAQRTQDGLVWLPRGYNAERHGVRLLTMSSTEADEILARLARADADRLVTVISDPTVAAHRLVDHSVVGLTTIEDVEDVTTGVSSVEITVEGVVTS